MKKIFLLAFAALLTARADDFPAFSEIDPLVRYPKNAKITVAQDGTFFVNGKLHYFLSAQMPTPHPNLYRSMKIPGAPKGYEWLYNEFPSFESLQRIGFDFIGASTPPFWIRKYSPKLFIEDVSTSAETERLARQLYSCGLPAYMDITCFEWRHGALAYGWMGAKKTEIPESARNTRYNTSFNRWAPYSFMHPEGRKLYREMWLNSVSYAKKYGTKVIAYELFNEAGYNDPSEYNRKLFVSYLKKRYGTPAKMNDVWKANYASFEEASNFKKERENPGLFVDWCKFMEDCAINLCAYGQKLILEEDPEAYVTNQINGFSMYRNVAVNNFNMYRMSRLLNAVVYPTGGTNVGNSGQYKAPARTLDTPDFPGAENLTICAYYKVLAEEKPLMNDECYASDSPFNAVWKDVIHGSSLTNFWAFASGYGRLKSKKRNVKGMQESAKKFPWELMNPFVCSVKQLSEFYKAKKEVAEFGEFFLPRDRGVKSETALILSYPTSRRSTFKADLPNANLLPFYTAALTLSHFPADVIAEEHLADGLGNRYKVIIAPGVSHAAPGTVKALIRFAQKGGVVIFIREFMEKDEYDNPNKDWDLYPEFRVKSKMRSSLGTYEPVESDFLSSALPGRFKGLLSSKAEFSSKWERISSCGKEGAVFRKACGKGWIYAVLPEMRMYPAAALVGSILEKHGVRRPFVVLCENGKEIPPNVEMHVSRLHGKFAVFFFNYDNYPKLLTLQSNAPEGFDLITKKKLPKTKEGFLYLLPPQTRGIAALGNEEMYRKFGPFSPVTVKDLQNGKIKFQTELDAKRKSVRTLYSPDPVRTHAIDLRKFCNRDYTDRKAGDGIGGWSDEGPNMGLTQTPLEQETLQGVPCDFVRTDMNEYRACIVLKSRHGTNSNLPKEIRNIPVGAKVKNLYFFHTALWVPKNVKGYMTILTYRIRYADGTTADIPARNGIEIGDWHLPLCPAGLKKQIAWRNSSSNGFFISRWTNPAPGKEVSSLDILSSNTEAVPIVIGITVEEAGAPQKSQQISSFEELSTAIP